MKRTLVLGASLNPERYSNIAVKRLRNSGIETKAFGLQAGKIEDVIIDTALVAYDNIDTVSLYIGPKYQLDYVDYVIGLKPKRVIFNPGTENIEFYNKLIENGIEAENACTLVLLSTNQY